MARPKAQRPKRYLTAEFGKLGYVSANITFSFDAQQNTELARLLHDTGAYYLDDAIHLLLTAISQADVASTLVNRVAILQIQREYVEMMDRVFRESRKKAEQELDVALAQHLANRGIE